MVEANNYHKVDVLVVLLPAAKYKPLASVVCRLLQQGQEFIVTACYVCRRDYIEVIVTARVVNIFFLRLGEYLLEERGRLLHYLILVYMKPTTGKSIVLYQ